MMMILLKQLQNMVCPALVICQHRREGQQREDGIVIVMVEEGD